MKYPPSFLSPLLAQVKLRFSGNNSGGSAPLCNIMSIQHCNNTMTSNSNISETPTFHKVKEEEQYTDIGLPLSEVIATFARKAKSVYESFLISERGQDLLAKAEEFEIPYDISNINFIELLDKVEEFERTIARANEYGIDWKNFGYDIMAIEDEINNIEIAESNYVKEARKDYYSSRLVRA